jgi:hypothetical protein
MKTPRELQFEALLQAIKDEPQEWDFDERWPADKDNYLILVDEIVPGVPPVGGLVYEIDIDCIVLIENDAEARQLVRQMYEAGVELALSPPDTKSGPRE